jgi:DNA-binding protein H-NS
MSKLDDLRKQMAALEAKYAKVAKEEIEAGVRKVKSLMSSLGVTLEHLTSSTSSAPAKKAAGKKTSVAKAASKRAGTGVPKYADPATGKTWTGVGRAPAWIADAKDRDQFLVSKTAKAPSAAAKAPAKKGKVAKTSVAKKAAAKKAAVKAPAPAAKKAAGKKAVAKKAAATKVAAKAPAKKAAVKKAPAKKAPAKKAARKAVKPAAAPVAVEQATPAAA